MTARDLTKGTKSRGAVAPPGKPVRAPKSAADTRPSVVEKHRGLVEIVYRREITQSPAIERGNAVDIDVYSSEREIDRWYKTTLTTVSGKTGHLLPHQKRKLRKIAWAHEVAHAVLRAPEQREVPEPKPATRSKFLEEAAARLNALPPGFTDDLRAGEPWPAGVPELLGPTEE